MIANEQKELIAIEVIRTLHSQFEKFPDEETVNRNAPFHELFLKTFSEKFKNRIKSIPDFISLASWMHGLNTSLGQSFFEKTSHILSGGVKKPFTTEKNTNLKISKEQNLRHEKEDKVPLSLHKPHHHPLPQGIHPLEHDPVFRFELKLNRSQRRAVERKGVPVLHKSVREPLHDLVEAVFEV